MMLGAVAIAAAASVSVSPAKPEFSAERMTAHVTFLADDLLEGRETGTRGHEIAARYGARQFALLGMKPAGDNGTYFQRVNFVEAARTGPPAMLLLTTPRGVQTFEVVARRGSPKGMDSEVGAYLQSASRRVGDSGRDRLRRC